MERLVTTSQAATILGLSVQGIHYRIKKNQLKSIKKSGKTFVYITQQMEREASSKANQSKDKSSNSSFINDEKSTQAILDIKDEQIVLLKDSMKWMKKQYKSEINRLEKNQKRIIKVFNSEIKLLQSAFNEMRAIYKKQPLINQEKDVKEEQEGKPNKKKTSVDADFLTLKEFSVKMKRYNKTQNEIKMIIFEAIKNGDERFIYNKKDKTILILNCDFEDLV
ncbi:MAG: DNA-binding protein [Campylobacterota bacterium]